MSDTFEMLVDVDASSDEAEDVSRAVLDHFRLLGLIVGNANSDCVLGEVGYCPGPLVRSCYKRDRGESKFWEQKICGVAPQVGRGFNDWALGPVFQGFICPSCLRQVDSSGDAFRDAVARAIGEWWNESGPGIVACPTCSAKRAITQWQCMPPLGFGYVSFRFWNWPPLDCPSWRIDILEVVRKFTGHTIVKTHGRI